MMNTIKLLPFLLVTFAVVVFAQSSPTVQLFQKSTSGMISDTVLSVTVDSQGIYYVALQTSGSTSTVGIFNGSEWKYPEALSNLKFLVYSLTSSSDGSLWLATSKGVMQYKESTLTEFTKTNTPIFKTDSFETIASHNNRIYAGNSSNGLLVYDNGAWKEFNSYYSSKNGAILGNVSNTGLEGITVTTSGKIYCYGSYLPILIFKNDSLLVVEHPFNTLPMFSATAVNESPNGEMWFSYLSTTTRGIVKMANSVPTVFDSAYFKRSFVFSNYNSIVFSANSKPWIGLYHGGLLTFDAGISSIKYDFDKDSVYSTKLFAIDKNDNKILTVGLKDQNSNTYYRGLVFYNEAGVTIPVNNEQTYYQPTEFTLSQNYPNPFNPSTTIAYSVASEGIVELRVYSMLGEEVATLVNEVKQAGSFTTDFDASHLPSGVYFYKLQSGDFVTSKKMILMK